MIPTKLLALTLQKTASGGAATLINCFSKFFSHNLKYSRFII
jgi:hypothetical protein